MARRGRGTAVLKRQREVKKAEKKAEKRERRETRKTDDVGGQEVATQEDLEAYGFVSSPGEDEDSDRGD